VNWSEIFLGVIAVATLIMAVIQVGAILAAARIAKQAQQTLATVQQELRPLVSKAQTVAEEASRTAAVARAQAEKMDKLLSDLAVRVDYTSGVVQDAIVRPARESMAVIAAIKATLHALRGFRDMRPRHGRHAEEEDPLFIG
jgi:hypothetical protein